MAEHNLTTAKYLAQVEEESTAAAVAHDNSAQPAASQVNVWARVASRFSVIAGAAVVVCLMAVVIPWLTNVSSGKPKSPIDWMLRLGGAKSDQTFEKWLRDSGDANRREWEELYRKSPAYQFDPNHKGWKFEPPAGFK